MNYDDLLQHEHLKLQALLENSSDRLRELFSQLEKNKDGFYTADLLKYITFAATYITLELVLPIADEEDFNKKEVGEFLTKAYGHVLINSLNDALERSE